MQCLISNIRQLDWTTKINSKFFNIDSNKIRFSVMTCHPFRNATTVQMYWNVFDFFIAVWASRTLCVCSMSFICCLVVWLRWSIVEVQNYYQTLPILITTYKGMPPPVYEDLDPPYFFLSSLSCPEWGLEDIFVSKWNRLKIQIFEIFRNAKLEKEHVI